ncbi:MAG: hypothetical protein HY013_06205 [Candidatus Solibacter usitatus]|nr:hypothetical protein [Candidatus Solibacter usitatus]
MTKRWIVVFTLFLAVTIVAAAADVTGKWTAQVPGRNGTRETTFTFKLDGDKLTGSMTGPQGQEIAISDGKLSGETLSFTVTVERGGNSIRQTYTGKVAGAEIQFKREGGQGPAREFTAKRAQ